MKQKRTPNQKHLDATEVMDSFDKSFTDIRDTEIRLYLDKISKEVEMHTSPLALLREELSHVGNELSLAYNSNIALNAVFHALHDQATRNKNLDHLTLCEEYCEQNQLSQAESQYFIKISSLNGIRFWLIEKINELELEEEIRQAEILEMKEGEFTTLRRTLAIQFLIKAAGKEIQYGEGGVNKTKIAEATDFLISKKKAPQDMRNNLIRKTLNVTWDKENRISLDNLNFLYDLFKKIGLTNISDHIDSHINKKIDEER